MPYASTEDLPESVRGTLPTHAQAIYKEAFNSAWDEYERPSKRRDGESREEAADRVAWAAVEAKYHKDPTDGKWKSGGRS